MKEEKDYVFTFKLWNDEGYMFAPNQIVLIDLHNEGKKFIGVIRELIFTEKDGGPTPLALIHFYPWWKDGALGGYSEIRLVPHRYCENILDPSYFLIHETETNRLKDIEGYEDFFIVNENNEIEYIFKDLK